MKKSDKGVVEKVSEVVGEGFSVERFVESFDVLAEAAGGTIALRSLVFQLAISGHLVPGRRADGSRMRASSERKEPFSLPEGWTWRRVDEVGEVKLGRQRSPDNHNGPNMRPYLRVANVQEARIDISDVLQMNFEPAEVERFLLLPNDILLNEGQSYDFVGRPAMYRGEVPGACFQNTLLRFRCGSLVLPDFALIVFRAYMRTGRFRKEAQQTTNIAHLSAGRLCGIEFPLPPTEVQDRIVTKVHQLLLLCDELEARQSKKREIGARLTTSALRALATAEGQGEILGALTRVLANTDDVIRHADSVDALRVGLVDMASRGKLTSRCHDDASVAKSLAARAAERRRLGKERESRKTGTARKNADWEDPYQPPHYELPLDLPLLPKGWTYAPIAVLGTDPLAAVQTGPFGQQLQAHEFVASGVPVIAVGNVTANGLSTAGIYHITLSKAQDLSRYDIHAGDLLFARSGATLGKVCIAPEYVKDWRMTGHILRVRLDRELILPELAAFWIRSSHAVKRQIEETIRGGTRPGYNTGLLESIALPIPPLAEQEQILEKLKHLLSLCDALEASLRRAEDRASRYAEAVVRELVA